MSQGPPPSAPEGARRVFISYARADRSRVTPLIDALTAEGFDVWWDGHIPAGAQFAREIQKALTSAHAVVVVWSSASIESDWVRDEAALGRDSGRLTPVRIDPVAAPLGFGQYQTLDLMGWTGDRAAAPFRRLIHALDPAAQTHAPPQAVPPSQAQKISRRALWGLAVAAPLAAAGGWWFTRDTAPEHSIAVLPFDNLTQDRAQELVVDGLSEEIRAALARIPALQVIARRSSEAFQGQEHDTAAIARRLGVAYLLDGALQKAGNILRINVQLIHGSNGFQIWSQTFDRPNDNLLALESDISGQVAAALQVKLAAKTPPGGTQSAEAYQFYLQARRLYDEGGDEASMRTAAGLYEQALAHDPTYADAQAGRARALLAIANQFAQGEARRSLSDQGLAAAEAAVKLAPDSADAQAALGFARMGRLDVKGAQAPYENAGRLGAGDGDRLQGYGGYEARRGRFDLAIPALQRAVLLDPLNPNAHVSLGDGLYLARRASEAMGPLSQALALNPDMIFAHSRRGDCLYLAGDAVGALAEYRAEPVALYRLTGLAIALQRLGKTAEAQTALNDLVTQTGDNGLYQKAQVLAQWGQTKPCLEALASGLAQKDSGLTRMLVDPMFDPVRREPGFKGLLGSVGLI